MLRLHIFKIFLYFSAGRVVEASNCKSTPFDSAWPSHDEWTALNKSLDSGLIRTTPVASSCWPGNPFGSSVSCDDVKDNWGSTIFHAAFPESIDYPIFANNSCLPPGVDGYDHRRGCSLGGLPEYIVNATDEQHVALAMAWAAQRNIRVVVKGTGHDMNGRSSGAYALSIWTRNLRHLQHHESWTLPNGNKVEHVFRVGSGQNWGNVLSMVQVHGRVVTTGQDPSVGLGGYIQGGGHGPLSAIYGLAAHQVLEVRVVTPDGKIRVANDETHQDLFWAVRGGGGGQFGVVTEFVIKSYPTPSNVTVGTIQIGPKDHTGTNNSWTAAAVLLSHIPDIMDNGVAGVGSWETGATAMSFLPSIITSPTSGIAISQAFFGYNMTPAAMTALANPVMADIRARSDPHNNSLTMSFTTTTYPDYATFFSSISTSESAGAANLMSTRLLGRQALVETPSSNVAAYLKTALASQNETLGSFITLGLQGGPGVANTATERFGAINPVWRDTYVHMIAIGATIDSTEAGGGPAASLQHAADWMENTKEVMWRDWAPDTGAYMNEANPYNTEWKHDFYGTSYEKLREVKSKYDPLNSLFVLNGVGSDEWDYNLDTGMLCRHV